MLDPARLDSVTEAADVTELLRSIFGFDPGPSPGVLHVVAVWRPGDGDDQTVMRIDERTPKSRLDRFVLQAARARSEAVISTGRILRQEPAMTLDGDDLGPAAGAALEAWRRDKAGLDAPPTLVVLTSGEDFPVDHPALASGQAVVLTSAEGEERLAGRLPDGVELFALEEPGGRAALLWLQDERGCRRISVEAGPTTALHLYSAPPLVDELWLSSFQGADLPRGVAGGGFLAVSQLAARFRRITGVRAEEESGRWCFERWQRRPGRAWRPPRGG